jgi:hypothetical protein
VGLDAILTLMPDRTHAQFVLLDAKRRFGLGKLNVGLPELLLVPISDIGTQQIARYLGSAELT